MSVMALVASAAACGGGSDTAGADGSLDKVSFQLQTAENGSWTPVWYGKSKGIYEKYGIDLEILPGTTSQTAAETVARGKADFGTNSFANIILNNVAGNELVGVSEPLRGGNTGLLVSKDSGITSFKDLPGKQVIVATGSSLLPLWQVALKNSGVKESDIKVNTLTPAAADPAFAAGQADANFSTFPFNEPTISRKRDVVELPFSEAGVKSPGYFLATSRAYFEKNPDIVKRFTRATQASWNAAYHDQKGAVEAVAKGNPAIDRNSVSSIFAAWAAQGCGLDDNGSWWGDFTDQEVGDGLQTLVDAGLVKASDVDLDAIFARDALDSFEDDEKISCADAIVKEN